MKKLVNYYGSFLAALLLPVAQVFADDKIMDIHLPSGSTNGDFVVSSGLVVFLVVLLIIAAAVGVYYGLKAQKLNKFGGNQILLDSTGIAITDISSGTKGKVKIHGEIWTATSEQSIKAGEEVAVKDIKLLVLKVEKFH